MHCYGTRYHWSDDTTDSDFKNLQKSTSIIDQPSGMFCQFDEFESKHGQTVNSTVCMHYYWTSA